MAKSLRLGVHKDLSHLRRKELHFRGRPLENLAERQLDETIKGLTKR
jgi:hypothetical protein